MNKKLLAFLSIIIFVLGYTIYESMKLDRKLGQNSFSSTGAAIKQFPMDMDWKHLVGDKNFDVNSVFKEKNKIVVHFWATWCGPCEVEFPELVELTKLVKKNSNVVFLFVAVNDELPKVQKFLQKFEIGENVVLLKDNKNQFKRLGTYKMPETYLFDAKGSVVKKYSGQQPWTQTHMVNYFLGL